MSRQLAKRWITVDEFERMGKAGVFSLDVRLELLDMKQLSFTQNPPAAFIK